MGFKRPFDDVEFQELPFKHQRQLGFSDERALFSDAVSFYNTPLKTYGLAEDGSGASKSQWHEEVEKYTAHENSTSVDKSSVNGAHFSSVTRNCRAEDVGSGINTFHTPGNDFEFDFPRRAFVPFEDLYSSSSDRSPRKQVPLGPNHQVVIPKWTGCMKPGQTDEENAVKEDREVKLLGTSVIPMPDLSRSELESDKVGLGRTDCNCLDKGTIRCVKQHVMEAREELRRTLGNEKFVKLGFCDMGEEVAQRWNEEEGRTFLEVVYSSPASLGRNFWKQLSAVFPSRSNREVVSYYFNVFMLRKRASQNRSNVLEIDSDDDEWHGNNGGANGSRFDDEEDSVVDPLMYQDHHLAHKEEYSEEDDSDEDSSGSDGDADVRHFEGDSSEEDGGVYHIADSYMPKSVDQGKYDTVHNGENISGCTREEFDFQDDSCVSFEFQSDMHDSCGRIDSGAPAGAALFRSGGSKCLHSQPVAFSDAVNHAYLLEPCDAKVWDGRFSSDLMKGVDLLPTWSMIENIFDQGTEDYKTRDERKAPAM